MRVFKEEYKNQKFGTLTLTGNYHYKQYPSRPSIEVECICECGNIVFKQFNVLRSGLVLTCGGNCPYCMRRIHSHTKNMNGKIITTKEYKAWNNIKLACNVKTSNTYKYVGALGITYCDEFETFKGFLNIMGLAPSKYHRLTRIDKSGDYEPGNLEWKLCGRKRKD